MTVPPRINKQEPCQVGNKRGGRREKKEERREELGERADKGYSTERSLQGVDGNEELGVNGPKIC
jgi:hypothetical protein